MIQVKREELKERKEEPVMVLVRGHGGGVVRWDHVRQGKLGGRKLVPLLQPRL